MLRAGETLLHYEFIGGLGEGGGIVWRALDTRLDREVAIKLLPDSISDSPEALSRLEREARALAALNHPNIVTIHAIEESCGHRFLVMELVRGGTLDTLIPPTGLRLPRLLDLAVPLADALAAAHARGIVHRDFKPRNVMVSDEGRPKILDFGLAAVRTSPPLPGSASHSSASTLSGPGRILGTMSYMPPEQLQGGTVDHRSDIFSFGVTLYEMATGGRPFRGDSGAALVASIMRDDPEPPSGLRSGLPPELDRVLHRCLAKTPSDRIQSAAELRDRLERLRGNGRGTTQDAGASVAVLPFADMSRERDQEYFCDGIAEEIIGALTKIAGIRVAARASSFQFRGTGLESRELARRLRVRTLLAGSVRKSGDRLRVRAGLVDAVSGFELWSETFDREMKDVFAIQEEIARRIASALEVTLTLSEDAALGRPPTSDVKAFDLCLRGRKYYYQYTKREVAFALEMFQNTLALDPLYARAWAGVADCHSFSFLFMRREAPSIQKAEAASRRALELDPDLAEAQASRGLALSTEGRDAEATAAFDKAIRLDPGLFEARYFYARHAFACGDLVKAAQLYEEAEALRPDDYQSPLLVAQIYGDLGRKEQAEAARRRGVRKAEAVLRLEPDDTRARYMAANGLVALGERERGLLWAKSAAALDPDEPTVLYNVGCIYAMAGQAEEAISLLERSVDRGLTQRVWFEHDNNLDPLRAHPRFQALMGRLARDAA